MNFFIQVLRVRLKIAITPAFMLAFLLLSAAILALGLIFNRDGGLRIAVGVLISDAPVASAAIENMRRYGRQDCDILLYDDETKLKQDVAANKLACAYVFTDGAEAYESDRVIIAYRSPFALTDYVTDLMVAAAYVETMAGKLGADVLRPYMADMDAAETTLAEVADEIQAITEGYLQNGMLMEMIIAETGQSAPVTPVAPVTPAGPVTPVAPYRRLFHGLVGLAALLLAWLCAMGFAGDTAVLRRIKSTGLGVEVYVLAGFGVVFFVVSAFIGLTLSFGALLYPGLSAGLGVETVMGLAYAFALAGTATFLAAALRNDFFPATITFVFIFAALLGGTFFDLREVIASFGFLRYFFVNWYYLDGVSRGDGLGQPVVLAATGLVSGAAALKVSRAVM